MNFLKAFKAKVPRWPRVSDVETVLHRNKDLNSGLSQFHRKRTNPISSFNRIELVADPSELVLKFFCVKSPR